MLKTMKKKVKKKRRRTFKDAGGGLVWWSGWSMSGLVWWHAVQHGLIKGGLLGLTRLEEEDGDLAEVKVDEVLGFVGDVGAEVAADDAVPGRVVFLVELLLDVGSDVLLDVEFLEGLGGAVNCVLLHVLRHVGILDHGLALRHLRWWGQKLVVLLSVVVFV